MILDEIQFSWSRRLPVVLQVEAAECGIACLSMIASFHGQRIDLSTLRRDYPASLKGVTLATIVDIADRLNLATRPLRLDMDGLSHLKVPCILHWNLNHFVVLKHAGPKSITIHDPARGVVVVSREDATHSFTGIALELWPNPGFQRKTVREKVVLGQLIGRVTGLWRSASEAFLLAVSLEVFGLVSPFFLQLVIDKTIVTNDHDLLNLLALAFGLLLLFKLTFGAVRSWVLMHIGTTLGVQWRANVLSHLLRLPVQYFQKRHLGDINSRFGSIDQIQATLTSSFIETMLDGIMSSLVVVAMCLYSPTLAAIAVASLLLYALTRWLWYGTLRTATASQILFAAKQQTHLLESIRGVRSIKLFAKEEQRRTAWLVHYIDQVNAGLRTQKLQIVYGSINGLLMGVENVLIIWLGAKAIMAGEFSVGALMAFKSYNDQFQGRATGLIDKFLQLKMLQLQGERLADIVLTEPEPKESSVVVTADTLPASLTVSNLRFRYAEQEAWVLNGVSFHVDEHESVAIVGPSGCGKSTLMNVLLGVYAPTLGTVSIGGLSTAKLGLHRMRRMIGTVLQDDSLFAGSIADNISFFDPSADQRRIEECAQLMCIHEEIVRMPMGYGSLVGDMGTVLSGGQKQRILLARALYKQPRLLLLDEATSHLDVELEKNISGAISSLNLTRIFIAHRPETIESAARIIVLGGGKVVEERRGAVGSPRPLAKSVMPMTELPVAPSLLRLSGSGE